MTNSLAYVLISISALAVIAILILFGRRKKAENKITPLAGVAFAFVVSGILFGENRLVGYSLMGIGILQAVAELFQRSRSQ